MSLIWFAHYGAVAVGGDKVVVVGRKEVRLKQVSVSRIGGSLDDRGGWYRGPATLTDWS